MKRALWLLAYAALSALAFVVDKIRDHAAEQIAPSPPKDPTP